MQLWIKKNFKNQHEHCKGDTEKFVLLLQKDLLNRYFSAWIYRFLILSKINASNRLQTCKKSF